MGVLCYYSFIIDIHTSVLLLKHKMNGDRALLMKILIGDDKAWKKFISNYSSFIYAAIAKYTDDYDEKMSTYLFILEKLKENNFSRIRKFTLRSSLSTWLTVVARNLTLDFLRSQYGRDFRFKPQYVSYNERNKVFADLAHQKTPEIIYKGVEINEKWEKLAQEIKDVFSRLEAQEVLLIKLVYFKQIKINEAGKILQIHSVYKFLDKTLCKLKMELKNHSSMSNADLEFLFNGDLA